MAERPVVLLCGEDELDKERRGYHRAFSRRCPTVLRPPRDGEGWVEELRALRPLLVLHPDGRPCLPIGLQTLDAATACFQIDTFVGTTRRLRWSMLYDHAFVFHPGYEAAFRGAGHPGACLLPHAAERELFEGEDCERSYDVGWVGATSWSFYRTRERVLGELAGRFVTNDFWRPYTPEEMAAVYRRSKVVVNVSRDDYPQDANMRCFEAMAAGALLVTGMPTELTALGFQEGVHFVGYGRAEDVAATVERFLRRPDIRTAVAGRARELVLREHTYDARVTRIFDVVRASGGHLAPARAWAPGQIRGRFPEYAWSRPRGG